VSIVVTMAAANRSPWQSVNAIQGWCSKGSSPCQTHTQILTSLRSTH